MKYMNIKNAFFSFLTGVMLTTAPAGSAQVVGGGSVFSQNLFNNVINNSFVNFYSFAVVGSEIGKNSFVTNDAGKFIEWDSRASVHYAGSDSDLTVADLKKYEIASGGTWGPLIQIPIAGAAVMLPYRIEGQTALDLSDEQVCQVFGVAEQTWGDVLGTGDISPVRVIYHGGPTGPTELLSKYLASVCDGWGFSISDEFANVVEFALGEPIPSHWIEVDDDRGVASLFFSHSRPDYNGLIGYLSPDVHYVIPENAFVAKVNGYLPEPEMIRSSLANHSPPRGAAAADPLAWIPKYVQPEVGYPIFGTTNLLLNQCYVDSDVESEVFAFVEHFNALNDEILSPGGSNHMTELNFVQLPTAWNEAVRETFLLPSSSLAIGNQVVCDGFGRPVRNEEN